MEIEDRSDDPRYFSHAGKNYYVEEGSFYWELFDLETEKEITAELIDNPNPELIAKYTKAWKAAEAAGLGNPEPWDDQTREIGNQLIAAAQNMRKDDWRK